MKKTKRQQAIDELMQVCKDAKLEHERILQEIGRRVGRHDECTKDLLKAYYLPERDRLAERVRNLNYAYFLVIQKPTPRKKK